MMGATFMKFGRAPTMWTIFMRRENDISVLPLGAIRAAGGRASMELPCSFL